MHSPENIHMLLQSAAGQQCFGADVHGFKLAPPMPEAQVARIESAIGVRLPEDYREFLTQVGAFGAGPGYGLVNLDHPSQWDGPASAEFIVPTVCVITGNDGSEVVGHSNFTPEREGMVMLADHGCGKLSLLVVNGEDVGAVYTDLTGIDAGLVRCHDDFWQWYGAWLDELRRGTESPALGDPSLCSTPRALSNYFRNYAEKALGSPEASISPEQMRVLLEGIGNGGIRCGTEAGRFFIEQNVRMCASCVSMLANLTHNGLRLSAIEPGAGPLAETESSSATNEDLPGNPIPNVDEYVKFIREVSTGDMMGALSRRGLSLQDYGAVATAWGQALAQNPELMARYAKGMA